MSHPSGAVPAHPFLADYTTARSRPAADRSVAAMPCPTCHRPRCVPKGSMTPRCFVCEPEQLWLDAEQAWQATPDDQKW